MNRTTEPIANTPLTYLAELAATSWKHGGELLAAAGVMIFVFLVALWILGDGYVLAALLPPVGAVLLFEAAVAAWRLHHRQAVALATTRSLLGLDAGERAELERYHAKQVDQRSRENPALQGGIKGLNGKPVYGRILAARAVDASNKRPW